MSMLRFEFANAVIAALGAKSYLQIGSARNLEDIVCAHKRSVHNASEAPAGPFDVVFVDPPMDGNRALFALQVAQERVSPTGVILVANVNPTEAWMQEVPPSQGVQLGQAWRAWVEFGETCGRSTCTADIDHGVGVAMPAPAPVRSPVRVDFQTFSEQRATLLNLTSPGEILRALRADAQCDVVIAVMSGKGGAAGTATPTEESAPVADPEPAPTPRRKRRDRVTP